MRIFRALSIAWLMTFVAVWAYGQQTGEVTGTVTDTTGALVAGATVTATNTATQQVRSAASNDTGTYTLPYLQPGVYDLRADKAGFKLVNTLNHPNWNVPANDPRNLATFGVITSSGPMRQLQFALKYSF